RVPCPRRVRAHREERAGRGLLPRARLRRGGRGGRALAAPDGAAPARSRVDRPAARRHRGERDMTVQELLGPLFPEVARPLTAADSPETIAAWDSVRQVDVILAV